MVSKISRRNSGSSKSAKTVQSDWNSFDINWIEILERKYNSLVLLSETTSSSSSSLLHFPENKYADIVKKSREHH